MKRITVFFGNYGSGKTELSLNTALKLAHENKNVSLIDLDIVNPYFRSSEHAAMLGSHGIRVISPVYANTAVDLPTLPPDIYSAFQSGYAVFDCGGDPVGAAALGSLKPQFDAVRGEVEVLFVVNTSRPFQSDAQQLADSLNRVQSSARLNADGIVLNTNLGSGTQGGELTDSLPTASALSDITGIPIAYVSGTKDSLALFQSRYPDVCAQRLELQIFTRPEWL